MLYWLDFISMKEQFLQKVTLECPSKPLLIQMILVLNTSSDLFTSCWKIFMIINSPLSQV